MDYVNKIINGDCLSGLKQIPDNTFDVIITSPPYADAGGEFTETNTYGTHRKYKTAEQHLKEDWLNWQIEVIDECLRTCKKWVVYNVACLANSSCRIRPYVYQMIGHYADRIHDIIIWNKPNGLPSGTPNVISNTYEFVILIKKNPKDLIKVNSKFFRNVITLPSNSNADFSDIHHAVMSKQFCEVLVKEFTNENDLVLDPFMGVGTTALTCKQLGRNYFGFEINEEYYKACLDRIENDGFVYHYNDNKKGSLF